MHIFHELPGLSPGPSAHVCYCVCRSHRFLYILKFARVFFLRFDRLVQECGTVFGESVVVVVVVAGLVIILGPVSFFGKVLVIISFGVIPFG